MELNSLLEFILDIRWDLLSRLQVAFLIYFYTVAHCKFDSGSKRGKFQIHLYFQSKFKIEIY